MNNKFLEQSFETLTQWSKDGIFLGTAADGKSNLMTIGWGGVNLYWNRVIIVAPVRNSRFSHQLLEANPQFTISIPVDNSLKQALSFCGTKSGRTLDKWAECQLTQQPGRAVRVPVVGEAGYFYECEVVYKQDLDSKIMSGDLRRSFYSVDDMHTLYYGEIVAAYGKE